MALTERQLKAVYQSLEAIAGSPRDDRDLAKAALHVKGVLTELKAEVDDLRGRLEKLEARKAK